MEDAKNLADALEKALDHLPKEEIDIPKPVFTRDSKTHLSKIANWEGIPLEHFFSGPQGRETMQEFIEFCRKGEFEIG